MMCGVLLLDSDLALEGVRNRRSAHDGERDGESELRSRGGAIAVGIIVAVIAAILLIVYITRYKSSVDSTAAAVPVLVAKNLIPKGTPGTVVATKQLYQNTSVPEDKVQAGAISDPNALNGRTRDRRHLPRLAAHAQQLHGRGLGGAERAARRQGARDHDDDRSGQGQPRECRKRRQGRHLHAAHTRRADRDPALPRQRHRPPGARRLGGNVVLKVGTRDASNMLFAANQTTLYFVVRPASGAAPTPRLARRPLDRDRDQQGALGRWPDTLRTLVAVDSGRRRPRDHEHRHE